MTSKSTQRLTNFRLINNILLYKKRIKMPIGLHMTFKIDAAILLEKKLLNNN